MTNKQKLDKIVFYSFIISIIGMLWLGFKNFGGFHYAAKTEFIAALALQGVFLICAGYLIVRFILWLVNKLFHPR